jgi:hypothetical protein
MSVRSDVNAVKRLVDKHGGDDSPRCCPKCGLVRWFQIFEAVMVDSKGNPIEPIGKKAYWVPGDNTRQYFDLDGPDPRPLCNYCGERRHPIFIDGIYPEELLCRNR